MKKVIYNAAVRSANIEYYTISFSFAVSLLNENEELGERSRNSSEFLYLFLIFTVLPLLLRVIF